MELMEAAWLMIALIELPWLNWVIELSQLLYNSYNNTSAFQSREGDHSVSDVVSLCTSGLRHHPGRAETPQGAT